MNNKLFADLGFTPEEARIIEMKTQAYRQIRNIVEHKKLNQGDLTEILEVPQPRVSELLNGKISLFSLEKLVTFIERLGYHTEINFKQAVGE